MFRVPEGVELLRYLNNYAEENGIKMGVVNVIGFLKNVKLGYYDISSGKYIVNELNGYYELASGMGNISLKDGKPFTHLHVVLGDRSARSYAGHLIEGTVQIAEVYIQEIIGEPLLERKHTTGNLWLWPIQ